MRVTAGLIAVLCTGVLSQALAADPPAPPPPAPAAVAPVDQPSATPPAGQQSATTPAAQQNAASPTAGTIKPGVTVVGTKPELTPQDKELLSRGYKLEMRHGEKYFCRTETQIDSRFPVRNCDTAQSIEAQRASSQEALRVITNDRAMVNH
jgi:hypothetical protein